MVKEAPRIDMKDILMLKLETPFSSHTLRERETPPGVQCRVELSRVEQAQKRAQFSSKGAY